MPNFEPSELTAPLSGDRRARERFVPYAGMIAAGKSGTLEGSLPRTDDGVTRTQSITNQNSQTVSRDITTKTGDGAHAT
jgi:hypothetical protein